MQRLASFVERHALACVLVGLTMLGVAIALCTTLQINQDFMALLPPDAPEVQRLDQLHERLGNQADLIIAIESPSREANIRFGLELSKRLRARSDMRWILFKREKTFFERQALLYMDLAELLELRDDVVDRIRSSVEENITEDFNEVEESDDVDSHESKAATDKDDPLSEENVSGRYDIDERMPEFMETDDGRLMVIKARPKYSPSDLEYAVQLNQDVSALAAHVQPKNFHPDMTVTVEGSFAEQTKRGREMRSAVVDGSLAALCILLLSIGLFFRSSRAVLWVLMPLLVSVTSALAFAAFHYGHLNLVSAFIFAVLLGLGIDFGVHVLSRYRDERGRGVDLHSSWNIALTTTGVSTAAGALSTAGAFLVLSLSRFQGFAQFGVVAAVGVCLALGAALTLMPALVILTAGKSNHTFGFRPTAPAKSPSTKFPKYSAIVVLVALIFGVYGAMSIPGIAFEYDLSKLGPKPREAQTKPSKALDEPPSESSPNQERWRDAAGRGTDTAPAIVLTDNLEQTEEVHRQLSGIIELQKRREALTDRTGNTKDSEENLQTNDEEDDDEDPFADIEAPEITRIREIAASEDIAEPNITKLLSQYDNQRYEDMVDRIQKVFSIYDFVPDWQPEKLVLIRDMRRRIDAKRDALTPKDRQSVDKWHNKLEVDKPFGVQDLPEFVQDQMRDDEGNLGTFVLFWARGPKADYKNAKRIRNAFFDLSVTSGTVPTAADYYALPAIIDAIADDGPMVISGAILVMLVATWLLMGGIVGPIVVFGTVGIALLWLAGIMGVCGWKANLFNLIALPLLFGMGQDDAMHLFHRYREEGDLRTAVRETGSAIFLTSWTTAVGFAGIFFANHRGLLSLALISVLGVSLCWLSSVIILPSAIRLYEWLRPRPAAK